MRGTQATNYVYSPLFCSWMILELRHGPCVIPISSINTEKSFMAFPTHSFGGGGRLKGHQKHCWTSLELHFFINNSHQRILFLIPHEQYYIIREMARAKARAIMLIEVPLTSTDTKINALHLVPLTPAPQWPRYLTHPLQPSLHRQTPPSTLDTPSHSPIPVKR